MVANYVIDNYLTFSVITSQLNRGAVSYDPLSGPDIEEITQQVRGFLNGTLTDIEVGTGYMMWCI